MIDNNRIKMRYSGLKYRLQALMDMTLAGPEPAVVPLTAASLTTGFFNRRSFDREFFDKGFLGRAGAGR